LSKTDPRRDRVAARISASQDRLKRDGDAVPTQARRDPLPDAWPPESYRGLAREYPWLTVAVGLGFGALLAALLPRNFAGKAGRRAMAAATLAAELGLAFGKQARDAAGDAAQEGLAKLDETTEPLRQRATSASKNARSQGRRLAGQAMKFAARLRN
jgi:ElaB/YqjD/DUF883 family membrane-anchored ribosome-binding protein